MDAPVLVTKDVWLEARQELLRAEKEAMRAHDDLAARRRALPWRLVEEEYAFDTSEGRQTLAELFGDRTQLVVYHFMFAPEWKQGCFRCSFWADNFDGIDVHLAHRDTAFLAVSNTSLEKIAAYRARMGWRFRWVSSLGSDFNRDFHVSFDRGEMQRGDAWYNYQRGPVFFEEMQGLSVFAKLRDGRVAHTYSTYGRGIDVFNGAYQILDLTPKGRDEGDAPDPMFWIKRHDEYRD